MTQNESVMQTGSELNDENSRIWRIRNRMISFFNGFRNLLDSLAVFSAIQGLGVFVLIRFMGNLTGTQTSYIAFGLVEIASLILTILFCRSFGWNPYSFANSDPSDAKVLQRKEKIRKAILNICFVVNIALVLYWLKLIY